MICIIKHLQNSSSKHKRPTWRRTANHRQIPQAPAPLSYRTNNVTRLKNNF